MKKILLSVSVIAAVAAISIGGTYAYFSATKTSTGNTFSTGTVTLGQSYNLPIDLNNLAPGQITSTELLQIQYTGSLPADLYFGLKAEWGTDLRSILTMQIEKFKYDGANWVSDGYVFGGWEPINTAFANWTKIKENIAQNEWGTFKVYVKVDPLAGNEYQGKTASNTLFIYAVQAGSGQVPASAPWTYAP